MKCKIHQSEQGAGVCAPCLHDRLLALIAAQSNPSSENHHRNPPPPILLPRSVSPHHRRSVDSNATSDVSDADSRRSHRFYHTSQVGHRRCGEKPIGCRRFPLFSSFFHHRRSDESAASPSSSWFSSLIHRDRKKKNQKISSPARKLKPYRVSDRGMSPVRDEEMAGNVTDTGYCTEPSATWQKPTPSRRRRNGSGFSGFSVCISPLVMAGPTSRRSQPTELGFSGELRNSMNQTHNRHVSGVGRSFGPRNRSRKLADPGRFR